MTEELSYALGVIERFCGDNNVELVHSVQCDAEVTTDEFVDVGTLMSYPVRGFGGSDMSPAINRLTEDSEVTAVIVLTDGFIEYPDEEPPYAVLWALVNDSTLVFHYGSVINLLKPESPQCEDSESREPLEFNFDSSD